VKHGWTLDDRRVYFTALNHSRHYVGGQGMPDFLKRIRNEALETLSDSQREALASLIQTPSDSQVLERSPPRPFVKKWTVDALASSLKEVGRGRNLRQGEAMFAAASCINCHRIAGRGTLVGPDLTSVSSRFSRRDLLQSIITPSQVVAEKYRSLQVITTDGKTYIGQLALGGDYRSPVLHLATDPARPFEITKISKSVIEEQRPSPVSWMPEGLLNTLTKNDILDLLAYLEARGEVPPE
jgi:putative heme-binding domain-containing protein